MRKIGFVLFSLLVSFSAHASAQDRIGNGGGLWACVETNGTLRSGELVDLFEARQEFHLYIPEGIQQTPQEIFEAQRSRLLRIHSEFSAQLTPYMARVNGNIIMVDAALALVDDSLWRIRPLPAACENGNWEYIQFANFTNYDRVLIRKDLWNSPVITALDKAALLFHEAIYLMLREKFGDANSVRARQITGLIFSSLSDEEIYARVSEILGAPNKPTPPEPVPSQWVCSTKNTYLTRTFVGIGVLKLEAAFDAKQQCQKSDHPTYCADSTQVCEPILSAKETVACMVTNTYTSLSYLGKGRNRVEAEGHAFINCEAGGQQAYCKIQQCE